jgi:hypothetical protein
MVEQINIGSDAINSRTQPHQVDNAVWLPYTGVSSSVSRLGAGNGKSMPEITNPYRVAAAAEVPDASSQEEPQAAIKPFSLGVPADRVPSGQDLKAQAPDLLKTLNTMSQDRSMTASQPRIQLGDMPKAVSSWQYRFDAFRQMVGQHGTQNVGEMVDALKDLSGMNSANFYNNDLQMPGYQSQNKEIAQLTDNLYTLDRLCDPEFRQKVKDLNAVMRKEGYTQAFPIEDLKPAFIDNLAKDANERKAFIAFENASRVSLGPASFIHDHPEYRDDNWPKVSLADRWQAYQKYEADKAAAK